jgi:hypothetical protein
LGRGYPGTVGTPASHIVRRMDRRPYEVRLPGERGVGARVSRHCRDASLPPRPRGPHAQEQTDRVRTLRGEETDRACTAHHRAIIRRIRRRTKISGYWPVDWGLRRGDGRSGARLPPLGGCGVPSFAAGLSSPDKGPRGHTAPGPAGTPTRPCPGHNELALEGSAEQSCHRMPDLSFRATPTRPGPQTRSP